MAERATFGDRMAALRNRRHELFAQALAKGETQERAYELAGYTPNRPHASRLATNGNVSARVATLQERMAVKVETTAEDLVAELEEARSLARSTSQASAMVAATLGKGKLLGLITDKVQDVTPPKELAPRPTADEAMAALKSVGAANGVTIQ